MLLAEDNLVNQKLAEAILSKIGCRVEVASNGVEAVALASALPFDISFMDCQMPEMDGYEAARRIREGAAPDAPRVPIIALTANAMDGDRERCLAAGMDDYVTKPLDPKRLRNVLAKWHAVPA